jgi:hypothetical protein
VLIAFPDFSSEMLDIGAHRNVRLLRSKRPMNVGAHAARCAKLARLANGDTIDKARHVKLAVDFFGSASAVRT